MKRCHACGEEKPYSEFYRCRSRKDGYDNRCKVCDRAKNKKYRQKMSGINGNRRAVKRRMKYLQGIKDNARLGGCEVCGYDKCKSALEFHHKDGEQKGRAVSRCTGYEQLLREVSKCIVVCANCHREIHAGLNAGRHGAEVKIDIGETPALWVSVTAAVAGETAGDHKNIQIHNGFSML